MLLQLNQNHLPFPACMVDASALTIFEYNKQHYVASLCNVCITVNRQLIVDSKKGRLLTGSK